MENSLSEIQSETEYCRQTFLREEKKKKNGERDLKSRIYILHRMHLHIKTKIDTQQKKVCIFITAAATAALS